MSRPQIKSVDDMADIVRGPDNDRPSQRRASRRLRCGATATEPRSRAIGPAAVAPPTSPTLAQVLQAYDEISKRLESAKMQSDEVRAAMTRATLPNPPKRPASPTSKAARSSTSSPPRRDDLPRRGRDRAQSGPVPVSDEVIPWPVRTTRIRRSTIWHASRMRWRRLPRRWTRCSRGIRCRRSRRGNLLLTNYPATEEKQPDE